MNIDLYERLWMWAAGVIIAVFIAVIGMSADRLRHASAKSCRNDRPGEGLHRPAILASSASRCVQPDGIIEVQMVGLMFAFAPTEVRVPGRPAASGSG